MAVYHLNKNKQTKTKKKKNGRNGMFLLLGCFCRKSSKKRPSFRETNGGQ